MHRPTARPTRAALLLSLLLALAQLAHAQGPRVGDMAPSIELDAWIGVEPGAEPTLERLRGKLVMLEFWGTWCPPCVRSMAHVQEIRDRYADLGLVVVAISNEAREIVEPFVRRNGYTSYFGCDPELAVVRAYGISQWPTTFLLDADGRIGWIGTPFDAEARIERLLRLPADAAGNLVAWGRALERGPSPALRFALERVIEKRPRDFDLARWAQVMRGASLSDSDAAQATPADPGELLTRFARAKDAEERSAALAGLASAGAQHFDLLAWARAERRSSWPLSSEELEQALSSKRYAEVLEALLHRAPSAEAIALAAADTGLAAWCGTRAPEARARAKKGLMAEHWLFTGLEPSNSQAFWTDLGVGGLREATSSGPLRELELGSDLLTPACASTFVDEELTLHLTLNTLASQRLFERERLERQAAAERAELLRTLRARYGERTPAATR